METISNINSNVSLIPDTTFSGGNEPVTAHINRAMRRKMAKSFQKKFPHLVVQSRQVTATLKGMGQEIMTPAPDKKDEVQNKLSIKIIDYIVRIESSVKDGDAYALRVTFREVTKFLIEYRKLLVKYGVPDDIVTYSLGLEAMQFFLKGENNFDDA